MSNQIRVFLLSAILPLLTEIASAQTGESRLTLPEMGGSVSRVVRGATEFRLEQSDYFSADRAAFGEDGSRLNTSLSLRINYLVGRSTGLQFKVKGKNEYSMAEKWNYGDIHEFYIAWREENLQVSAGRKLETWATWDSDWQLGVFQPRYLENKIYREEAGLTGIFFATKSDKVSATLAYLPLNIPDFGPHFYVRDGSLYSRNPWFHPPTDRFYLRGIAGDIRYSVQEPEAMAVLNNPGAAAKLEYREGGFSSRLSAAYKPLSMLLISFPSEKRETLTDDGDHFHINIIPRVVYDRIVSWDNSYQNEEWRYSLSVAHDNPEDKGGAANSTSQQVLPANIFAGNIERQMNEGAVSARVGFIKVHGGDAPDRGYFADEKTLFDRRFMFYEAYLAAVKTKFSSALKYPIDTELKVIYDRIQQGGILSVGAGVNFTRELRANLQADFMGLLSSSATVNDGFFDTYRANDRVAMGVSYVF